jgi:hypothetical protein
MTLTHFFHATTGWGYPVTLHFRVTVEPFSTVTGPFGCILLISAAAVIEQSVGRNAST